MPDDDKVALPTFTIPVAFSVNAVDERAAAIALVEILAKTNVLEQRDGDRQIVESWWTPNHAWADNSDDDGPLLMWAQRTCARSYCDQPRDYFLHRPSSECVGCAAPQDHHEFVLAPAK